MSSNELSSGCSCMIRGSVFPDGGKAYLPAADSGSAGFIDFTFGDYNRPGIGMELLLKYGWSHEEVVYDFMKLIDRRNPFEAAFSFNVIIRDKRLTSRLPDFEHHIEDALEEAIHRLDGDWCGSDRELHFFISEISDRDRRHWHFNPIAHKFQRGIW